MLKTSVASFIIFLTVNGCASTTPAKIYFPSQNAETVAYYRNGLPIGALQTEHILLMTAVEPTEVTGKRYMRLWLLYKNNADSSFLLEPLKAVKLSIVGEKKTFSDITPESPTYLLARIENEKTSRMITEVIGGALEALSTQPTTITGPQGDSYTVNDKGTKIKAVVNTTTASMSATSALYDVFQHSINSGILRRNTLFRDESANGFMYFPLPQITTSSGDVMTIKPEKYKFVFTILTQAGEKNVEFSSADGE